MEELTALLLTPAGAFFHQLTITLILFGTIIVAIGRNSPETPFPTGRMLLGLFVMLIFRLALSAAAIIQISMGENAAVQALLERGLSTASTVILVWLWVFPDRSRTADAATLILTTFILALTLTGIGTNLQALPAEAGNLLFGAALWQGLSIGFGLIGILLLLRLRPPVWGYGVSLLTVLIAGEIAGLWVREPAGAVIGILRLSQIAALPVLLTLPQRILPAEVVAARVLPVARPTPERKRVNLPPAIFENFLNMTLEKDLLSICRYASEIVSFSLVADICLVLSRPTAGDEIIIFCGYDQVLEQEIGGAQIAARHLPMIASAIQKHTPLRLPASSASSDLKFLSSSLRLPKSGHLLVAPIRTRHPSDLGALVLLTPYSSRTWTQDDQAYLARAAEGFASILDKSRTHVEHEDVLLGVERELEETRERERQTAAELQVLKKQSPIAGGGKDEDAHANLLSALETEAEARRRLEEEIEALREDRSRLTAEIADQNWDQTIQHLQAENIQLQLAVDELESDLEDLHTRAEGLKLAREETLAIVEKLTAENRLLVEELDSFSEKTLRVSENGNPSIIDRSQEEEALRSALTEIAQLRNMVGEGEIKIVELENLAAAGSNITQQWESIIGLAEEMRQPMSSILGYSDFLLTESVGLLGALQRKFLERVKSSTNRMSTMVEDLIYIAAAESGKLKLSLGKVDLNSLIDSAVASTSAQIREKKIALLVNLPDDIPMIEGDREAIRLTLVHLLQNAAAASPNQGEISIEIKLEKEAEGPVRFVRISVRDSGAGIAPEEIESVFDRKTRSRDRPISGLGVSGTGLSIARTLVEAHGGRIWVESGPDPGTAFAVLLPVTQTVSETLFRNREL